MEGDKQRTALVTGATDGLGRAVALALAERGFAVLVHGRNQAKGEALAAEIAARGVASRFYQADFADLAQVARMANAIVGGERRLHLLVNNAGIMELERKESADGNELPFQVNYLAHYLLTRRLVPLMELSVPARIVNIASAGQAPLDFDDLMITRDWSRSQSYCQSKLAQIMMTFDMAPELEKRGISITALHPGTYMPTKMVVGRFEPQTPVEVGVGNVVRLAADPALAEITGRYFNGANEARAADQAYDKDARARLRQESDRLTA